MRHRFLVDTYETEILKVLGVWSMFEDGDMDRRPNPDDPRGRSLLEQIIHQCVSEDFWFSQMANTTTTSTTIEVKVSITLHLPRPTRPARHRRAA